MRPEVTDDALEAITQALAGRKGKGLILSEKETRGLMRSDVECSLAQFWSMHTYEHGAIVPRDLLRTRKGREAIVNEARKLEGMIVAIEAELTAPQSRLGPFLDWPLEKMKRDCEMQLHLVEQASGADPGVGPEPDWAQSYCALLAHYLMCRYSLLKIITKKGAPTTAFEEAASAVLQHLLGGQPVNLLRACRRHLAACAHLAWPPPVVRETKQVVGRT
jgi:hypothetical protein